MNKSKFYKTEGSIMRLKNYFILFALIFTLCFLQAGKGYSARLSDGNGKVTSPQKTKVSDLPQAGVRSKNENAGSAKKDQRLVQMDYDNADISQLINFISNLTGKNFIVDNNIKGKITIISPTKITVDEAYKTFESVLEVNGFTTVPSGKSIKIVPIREAIKKDLETRFGNAKINLEDRIITQIIPLKYASPNDLKRDLSAFSSAPIIAYEPTGMIIVTDVQSNVSRLLKIIKAIDIPGTGEEINVIPLKQASAQTMASNLEKVFRTVTSTGRKTSPTNPQITIVPDERTNSLIVVASEVDILKMKELVNLLDKNRPRGEGAIRVYPLQNADAEELANTLNAIPKETKQAGQQGTATALSRPPTHWLLRQKRMITRYLRT